MSGAVGCPYNSSQTSSVGVKRSSQKPRDHRRVGGRFPPQVRLMLVDTAGQEEFDALTESYYLEL